MLIDRFLPSYDTTLVCETSIAASPDEAYAAMRETNLLDPVIKALFTLRELPLRIVRRLRREPPPQPAPSRVTFGDLLQQGPIWVPLLEEPGLELVIGSVGRFWQKDYGARQVAADDFIAFAEPGYAKLALSLAVRPTATGAMLRYEARTATTDDAARRKFRGYWRIIARGVALVMRRALRRIKVAAERPAVTV